MIYLSKTMGTEVLTDNIINFIPNIIDVYLDGVLEGKFANLSNDINFIKFILPLKVREEKEYKLEIYNEGILIKEELVIVSDLTELSIKSITQTNNIKMYEK